MFNLFMPAIVENFKSVIIQIATPYTTGTGFLLPQFKVIVTNEHVISDNKDVVIEGIGLKRRIARVLVC
jgi:serine protease Do